MLPVMLHRETPREYFKRLVETALTNQGAAAGDLTAFYLVNLLSGFVRVDGDAAGGRAFGGEPLALRLGRAYHAGGRQRREELREVGDVALFVAGFFGDSLQRRVVDIDYYVAVGGTAYDSLSRCEHVDARAEVFAELAGRFVAYVDVLAEVSERSALASSTDLLRTYEKWLRTGSRREGQRLVAQGIVPNASIGSRFIQ